MGIRVVMAGALVAAATLVGPILASAPADAAELSPVISNEPGLVGVALDAAGNVYVAENNGAVKVLSARGGTFFGTHAPADTLTTVATLTNVPGLAFDAFGDLFMTDTTNGTVSVLSPTGGRFFGIRVPADTVTAVATGLTAPVGLAFDSSGSLYIATQTGVSVLSATGGTLFGTPVTADTPTPLVSGLGKGAFVAFDPSGNLYVSDVADGTVSVLARRTGTIFGNHVPADTPTTLLSGLSDAAGLAFDPAGNLYVDYYGIVGVLPRQSGVLFGTPVTANQLTTIATGLLGDLGSTFHAGSLYVADQVNESVDRLTTPTARVFRVTFLGSVTNPQIVVTGAGFNTSPPAQPQSASSGCPGYTGDDYPYGNLFLSDNTRDWGAGTPGDCIGLNVSVMTGTTIVFTLGSFYSTFALDPGDSYTIGVDGTTVSGTVVYTSPWGR